MARQIWGGGDPRRGTRIGALCQPGCCAPPIRLLRDTPRSLVNAALNAGSSSDHRLSDLTMIAQQGGSVSSVVPIACSSSATRKVTLFQWLGAPDKLRTGCWFHPFPHFSTACLRLAAAVFSVRQVYFRVISQPYSERKSRTGWCLYPADISYSPTSDCNRSRSTTFNKIYSRLQISSVHCKWASVYKHLQPSHSVLTQSLWAVVLHRNWGAVEGRWMEGRCVSLRNR